MPIVDKKKITRPTIPPIAIGVSVNHKLDSGINKRYPPTSKAITADAFRIFKTPIYSTLIFIIWDNIIRPITTFNVIVTKVAIAAPTIPTNGINNKLSTMFAVAPIAVTLNESFWRSNALRFIKIKIWKTVTICTNSNITNVKYPLVNSAP